MGYKNSCAAAGGLSLRQAPPLSEDGQPVRGQASVEIYPNAPARTWALCVCDRRMVEL